ncbi:hypothetical protein PISL3812_06001 [Talaromyces islandicus]|uniref:INO80 complex subunit F domain-containing protein n=1 Tax=Talaromyces islandicus TaxID=28573 RepID=A0A0U1M1E5_TALIS|nr:hypothetical protein PISL3812_06001 [Talaromyces islandicus]
MDTTASSTAIGNGGGNTSSLNNNANPPSIELAYKKKCIQLKKRLNEIETENDSMRARNKRAKSYIQKMRLETCIMLERLATLTGMLDEQQGSGGSANAELRARAAAVMGDARAAVGHDVLDDETEGSSEERPPTPQDRPLRVKRSRRSNMPIDELEAEAAMQFEAASPEKPHTNNMNNNGSNNIHAAAAESELAASGLPALAPAPAGQQSSQQDQQPTTSGFRAVNSGDAAASSKINNSSNNAAGGNENGGPRPADEPVPMDVDERVAKSES